MTPVAEVVPGDKAGVVFCLAQVLALGHEAGVSSHPRVSTFKRDLTEVLPQQRTLSARVSTPPTIIVS